MGIDYNDDDFDDELDRFEHDADDPACQFKFACRKISDDIKCRRCSSPDRLADTLIEVDGYGPLMLPVDDRIPWGEMNQNFCFKYLTRYGSVGVRYPGFCMTESDVPQLATGLHEKLHSGVREGSMALDGDVLSVTPSVSRGVKPKAEDIVLGLMIGQEMSDERATFSMTYDFIIQKVFPHLRDKKYTTPFEFAYDCIRYIKGYVLMMCNHHDDRLVPFDWVENVVKNLAKMVGNRAYGWLNEPRQYDLSDEKRRHFYEKAVDVFGESGGNAEIVVFLMDNFDSLGDFKVLDDCEVVELIRNVPTWVKNGFVIDRATGLYKACRNVHGDAVLALKTSLHICDNIYGVTDRPWWFKENEDLVKVFDLKSDDVSVKDGKLMVGVCAEGFDLVRRISEAAGSYFVHACALYKAAGYRLVEGGLAVDEAISITSDIAKWYGVYNVPRGVRVVEHLLAVLPQCGDKQDAVAVFRQHMDRYKPESPFIGKMEGDATMRMPGLNILLGVAKGHPIHHGEDGKDEFTLGPSDMSSIEDFLARSLSERAAAENPLLPTPYKDRQRMLTGSSPLMLEDHHISPDDHGSGALIAYMRFNERLLQEAGYMSKDVSAVYFNLFAQKMVDPLNPPKGLLKALARLNEIRVPMEIIASWRGTRFVRDDASAVHGISNESMRYLALVSLFDARNMGLVTDEYVDKVLNVIAVDRPRHDEDWAEVKKLKDEEKLQREYLGLPPDRFGSGLDRVGDEFYEADKSWREIVDAERELMGVTAKEISLFSDSEAELEAIVADGRYAWDFVNAARHVLKLRKQGLSAEDFEHSFSQGELVGIRDTKHSYMRRDSVDDDYSRPTRFSARNILELIDRHQARVDKVCALRARGLTDQHIECDEFGQIERDDFGDAGGVSGSGEEAARFYVERVWGQGKVKPAYRAAASKDAAHQHRLYDFMGPMSDLGVALSDAINLVRMGVLTVGDLKLFAQSQIDSLLDVGSVRYQPVTIDECQRRKEVGDEARKYEFQSPIDPKRIDEMIAIGVLNIRAFRDAVRTIDDVPRVTKMLLSVVRVEAVYMEALEASNDAISSVIGMLDRSWIGFSPQTARDSFLEKIRGAREKFLQVVSKCQQRVIEVDPEMARFLNFSMLGDQLSRFEEAVINWFAKMVPNGASSGAASSAVGMLYIASKGQGTGRNIKALDGVRWGGVSEGARVEEMRQLSDDMLDITSRLLAYMWIVDPTSGGHLVQEVQRVLEVSTNAEAGSAALVVREQIGRLSLLSEGSEKALELLLPQAREAIIEARRKSAYLETIGGKVHTVVPMDPRYFDLIRSVLGISNSPFRLAHGHHDKTLVLPPTSSPLEMSLLLNGLVLFGVIPLRAADVRIDGGRDDTLPDAQIGLPSGRLNAENCAFLGSCVLLATDDGVAKYAPESFLTNDSGTGARTMIHDGGAANLPLPFIYGMKNGRVDMLGRRSVLDIENLQLLGTVLSHSQFGHGPFGKFADEFKAEYHKILLKHGLAHVLEGSWVHDRRSSYTKREQEDHLKVVNDCCAVWHAHSTAISDAVEQGLPPPDGIIFEVNKLLGWLRDVVSQEARVLYKRGEYSEELKILLAGEAFHLPTD